MQGQLSQFPLVEIIRELVATEWSGALRLTQDRLKMVIYFERGTLIYANSNLKQFRLSECLRRAGGVSDDDLDALQAATLPDAKLAHALLQKGLLDRPTLDQMTTWQVGEILNLALQWTTGNWELQARVKPIEKATINLQLPSMLMEAARKLAPETVNQRLFEDTDIFEPANFDLQNAPLLPNEAFVMTRLFGSTKLHDLLSISGLPDDITLHAVYSLALGGFLQRKVWPTAFSIELPEIVMPDIANAEQLESPPIDEKTKAKRDLDAYLARMELAQDFYQMIGVEADTDSSKLKHNYYNIARKFHPDLYRNAETTVRSRIETEFARVTRAYETLKDEKLREAYNAKISPGTNVAPKSTPKTPTPSPAVNNAKDLPRTPPPPEATNPLPPNNMASSATKKPPGAQNPPQPVPLRVRKAPSSPASEHANPVSPFLSRDDNQRDAFQMPPTETGNTKIVDELMQKRAAEQFQRGLAALASRDHVSAIACLAEATRLDPSKARYHAYFGRALSGNMGARRQAENELNEAIRLEPSNLDYQVMLAEFYWNAGFPLRCQGEIKRVLEKNPFHPEARALRDKLSADTLKK